MFQYTRCKNDGSAENAEMENAEEHLTKYGKAKLQMI